ncbi:MAG TPA: hypothetical protein VLK35_00355 [Methylomirabilota bacterium]|nr:hypothetical protein [Methylomirabilota bacterium]
MKAPIIVATVVAIAAGVYSGIHLLIPLAATGVVWWAARSLRPDRPADFVAAAAVQAGHLLWIAIGLVVIGAVTVDLVDIAILLAGAVWLVTKPGRAAVIVLTVYQGAGLLINLAAFLAIPIGENLHRALLIHIIWRVLALIFMWRGRRRAAGEAELAEEV